MATLAQRAKTVKQVEAILDDATHPQFMKALEFAANRGFGPVPSVHQGGISLDVVIRDEASR